MMGHIGANKLWYHWSELRIQITIPGVEPAVLWVNWKTIKIHNRWFASQKWSIPFENRVYTSMMDPKGHHYPLEMKMKSLHIINYKINLNNYEKLQKSI